MMGNLNFQDDPNENPEKNQNQDQNQDQDQNQNEDQSQEQEQNQPELSELNDVRADEGFIDDPTTGSSKLLWIAIIVVVIAGIGGALYMFNRAGYLKFFGKKKPPVVTTMKAPASRAPAQAPVEAKKPAPAVKPSPRRAGGYALQVSAFRTRGQAERYISSLREKGIHGYMRVSETGGTRWFGVCTGSFNTKLKAIAAIESMKKKVGTDVWVVPAQ